MTHAQLHVSEEGIDTFDLESITSERYLRGRPPTAAENPRGKHHRRPLPWKRQKLCTAQGYDYDAVIYREWLWAEEKKRKQKEEEERDLQQRLAKRDPPPPDAKPAGTPAPNTTRRVQGAHFLKVVDAHAKRHRDIYYRCGCCYDMRRTPPLHWWNRQWPLLRDEATEDAKDRSVPLPGDHVVIEWETPWWDDRPGPSEGQYLTMAEVASQRSGVPEYTVRYKLMKRTQGRRGGWQRVAPEEASVVEEKSHDDVETPPDVHNFEWEFVRSRPDAPAAPMSDGVDDGRGSVGSSEWLAVSESVASWDDVEDGDWEAIG